MEDQHNTEQQSATHTPGGRPHRRAATYAMAPVATAAALSGLLGLGAIAGGAMVVDKMQSRDDVAVTQPAPETTQPSTSAPSQPSEEATIPAPSVSPTASPGQTQPSATQGQSVQPSQGTGTAGATGSSSASATESANQASPTEGADPGTGSDTGGSTSHNQASGARPGSTTEPGQPAVPGDPSVKINSAGDSYYVVVPGDTLSSISGRVGISVEQIAQYNGVEDVNMIYAGSALRLPFDQIPRVAPAK